MSTDLQWGKANYISDTWEWAGFVLPIRPIDEITEELVDTVEKLMCWGLDIDQPGKGLVTGHVAEYLRTDYLPELEAEFGAALDVQP